MKNVSFLFAGFVLMTIGSSFIERGGIEKISTTVVSRQVQKGKSITLKSDLYYQSNGVLVSHYIFPKEYILITNKLGETKLYDPADNTVYQSQAAMYSSQTSQISYFLSGRSSDMGLTQIGYVPEKTYQESNLLVTLWKLKTPNKKTLIQQLKTVYYKQSPVYVDYRDKNDHIIRKVYYYNYQQVGDLRLPATTTEIVYANNDSTITKTSYSDFRINEQASGAYFDFTIPRGAKVSR